MGTVDKLKKSLSDAVAAQEPLGAEFERVLYENLDDLLEREGTPISNGGETEAKR